MLNRYMPGCKLCLIYLHFLCSVVVVVFWGVFCFVLFLGGVFLVVGGQENTMHIKRISEKAR